jgi:hypothetical protein
MIDDKTYRGVLESGLILDHYFLLCNIKNGKKSVETRRILGFKNLLTKKGYIDNLGNLTEKGAELVENCAFAEPVEVVSEEIPQKKELKDFGSWVVKLHGKCQDKIYVLTGKRQVKAIIDKKSYPFLPNSTDLGKALHKAITMYKLTDHDKIEKTILAYISRCNTSKHWFPLLGYYIMKNGVSQLVTEMEGNVQDESDEEFDSPQKFV